MPDEPTLADRHQERADQLAESSRQTAWRDTHGPELLADAEFHAETAAQLRRLERWKAEALVVLDEWAQVSEVLGRPARLGETYAAGALRAVGDLQAAVLTAALDEPIPMRLPCPSCGVFHIDEGEWATKRHHTHACQHCGLVWRPAVADTVGVQFLPGYRNDTTTDPDEGTSNMNDDTAPAATSIPNLDDQPLVGPGEMLDRGYVMEINRRILHPLGLALAVDRDKANADGSFPVQVWDYRDDPEGFLFADLSDDDARDKAQRVEAELAAKRAARTLVLGNHVTQPGAAVIQRIGSVLAPSPEVDDAG